MTNTQRPPAHLPRRSGVGIRQVFGPHPWRELLRKSREGGPATEADAEDES